MMIRCPHCGRDGRLPDELASQRRILRCRKCQGRFTTHTQLPSDAPPFFDSPFVGAVGSSRIAGELARLQAGAALLDDDDDDDLPPIVTDPDDSNYEVTVPLEGELDDSQFELPALTVTDAPTPETQAAAQGTPPRSTIAATEPTPFPPEPRYYALIDSWSRHFFYGVVTLAAPSLLVLGVFLARAFFNGQSFNRLTTALILGFVATFALLLIAGATTALNLLLVDLARNTRQLRMHAERGGPVATTD